MLKLKNHLKITIHLHDPQKLPREWPKICLGFDIPGLRFQGGLLHVFRIWPSHRQSITKPRNMRDFGGLKRWNGDFSTTGGTVSENEKHNCYTSENLTCWKVKVWFQMIFLFEYKSCSGFSCEKFPGCKNHPWWQKKQPEVFKLSQLLEVQIGFACKHRGCSFWKTLLLVWFGHLRLRVHGPWWWELDNSRHDVGVEIKLLTIWKRILGKNRLPLCIVLESCFSCSFLKVWYCWWKKS